MVLMKFATPNAGAVSPKLNMRGGYEVLSEHWSEPTKSSIQWALRVLLQVLLI